MKRHFISVLTAILPMMAVGQSQSGVVIAESDFTTATEFTYWSQFADVQTDGRVELKAGEGVAITVDTQTGEFWQPQVMLIPDGSFDLEDGGKYKVIITAKFPTNGTLQINMGSWSANDLDQFPITATDDFQVVECNFDNWLFDAEDAHLLFQCGDFKGTTIVKKIQVVDMNGGVSVSDIAYNFIPKGKIAEVIHKNYKGGIIIPSTVMCDGEEYTVTKIAENAFLNCTKLTSVTLPTSVTSIGNYAFKGCTKLTSVDIPNNVSSIGNYAFENCSNLKSITIPNSVTSIGLSAFEGCKNLASVNIPNSITTISSSAFRDCSGLTSVTIPNSVTSIDVSAFNGCSRLTSMEIPNSVMTINGYAFANCKGLKSVTIPNDVTVIDNNVFYNCVGLTSITIPNNVTSIGTNAFLNCSGLTSVTIGEKVNSINSTSFSNCQNLSNVYCLAGNVPNTINDAFKDSYIEYATLHVPAEALGDYSNAVPWKNFKDKVAIGSSEIPETKKCAKPTITFQDGKLTFSCATEGAEFISEITAPTMTKKYDNEISLNSIYTVTVYATKVGYINSDKAFIEIQANSGITGDLTGDGKVDVADHVRLSNIILGKMR